MYKNSQRLPPPPSTLVPISSLDNFLNVSCRSRSDSDLKLYMNSESTPPPPPPNPLKVCKVNPRAEIGDYRQFRLRSKLGMCRVVGVRPRGYYIYNIRQYAKLVSTCRWNVDLLNKASRAIRRSLA